MQHVQFDEQSEEVQWAEVTLCCKYETKQKHLIPEQDGKHKILCT